MTRLLLAGVVAAVAGCSSPRFVGAAAVSSGDEPAGRTLAEYELTDCQNAAGAKVRTPAVAIRMIETASGRVLVEQRAEYDSLVVMNGRQGRFGAITRADSGPSLGRDYRLPSGEQPGVFTVGAKYRQSGDTPFVVDVAGIAFRCAIVVKDSPPPAEASSNRGRTAP